MNELYSYPANDYRYYLAHHGIKGQRWGVRRYQNLDGTLTSAGKKHVYGSGKKGVIERKKIKFQGTKNTISEVLSNAKKSKNLEDAVSNLVGHGARRIVAENRALTERRLANASRTKLGKHIHNINADNAMYRAQYHTIKENQTPFGKAFEAFVPYSSMNMPMKTITGRTTTAGSELIRGFMSSGISNIALDVAYAASKKRGGKFAKELDAAAKNDTQAYLKDAEVLEKMNKKKR